MFIPTKLPLKNNKFAGFFSKLIGYLFVYIYNYIYIVITNKIYYSNWIEIL